MLGGKVNDGNDFSVQRAEALYLNPQGTVRDVQFGGHLEAALPVLQDAFQRYVPWLSTVQRPENTTVQRAESTTQKRKCIYENDEHYFVHLGVEDGATVKGMRRVYWSKKLLSDTKNNTHLPRRQWQKHTRTGQWVIPRLCDYGATISFLYQHRDHPDQEQQGLIHELAMVLAEDIWKRNMLTSTTLRYNPTTGSSIRHTPESEGHHITKQDFALLAGDKGDNYDPCLQMKRLSYFSADIFGEELSEGCLQPQRHKLSSGSMRRIADIPIINIWGLKIILPGEPERVKRSEKWFQAE